MEECSIPYFLFIEHDVCGELIELVLYSICKRYNKLVLHHNSLNINTASNI